ncbi:CBS domain-containing protein [Streptosporangium sp. OZ121]|uniref:CBS domain-containing protein n=1 Tax=Streptosporangium sp. OZ121 TaxID=3444183 RepID=UPI003F78CF62
MSIEVKDVMGHVAIAVDQDATFSEIVRAMGRYAVGAVTVIDADRRPVGVVSEDDLLLKETDAVRHSVSIFETKKARDEHRKAAGFTAAELMTSPAIVVTPGTPVRDAARLMHDRRIKQVPVIDVMTGRVVGTLHQRDVLRVFLRPAGELEREIMAAIDEPGEFTLSIDQGVVTVGGRVESASKAVQLEQAIRGVEGVVDVISQVTHERDDILIVPPLL